MTVCMISCLHYPYDDRIYWKESVSLATHGFNVIHVSVGDADQDIVTPEGIRLLVIEKKRFFQNPFVDILFRKLTFRKNIYKKILSVCKSLHADVYHYHDVQISRLVRDLKHLPQSPRVIYDVHEDYPDLLLSHYPAKGIILQMARVMAARIDRIEMKGAQACDFIIGAVEHIRLKFEKIAGKENTLVIHNYTIYKPQGGKAYEDKQYDAIYSGQINDQRCALEIAQAVLLTRRQLPRIRVIFVGPVPDRNYLHQLTDFIGKNNLQDNLIIHGNLPFAEMKKFYADSRIGLGIFKPVSIFRYGIQVKTFEYMAFGLPIIGSREGSISEIIRLSSCGIAVNPLSPDDISKAIVSLLTDRKAYDSFSRNGIQAAEDKYNWKTEEQKLLKVYERFKPAN